MSDLLVRGMSEGTKERLRVRAASNGRSQQAEAKAILDEALCADSRSWVARLRSASLAVGGIDFPELARHAPRETPSGEWL